MISLTTSLSFLFIMLSQTISRVMSLNGHLSRPAVAGRLKQPTREQTGRLMLSVRSCFEWGLHGPLLLPGERWSLTPPFHPYTYAPVRRADAVYFCCTFPGVASARRYLAPCPLKPGLSSPASFRSCSSDHLSYSEPPYYTTIFFVCPYRRSGIFFYPFIPSGSFLR